jgi:uncharacterized protein (TIGR03084 family)
MPTDVNDLAGQHAELAGLVEPLDEVDWLRPSPLEGWTIADVVLHLAQTDEMALASVEGRLGDFLDRRTRDVGPATSVDDGAALMVAHERGAPGRDVFDRWRSSSAAVRAALGRTDPHRRVEWVAGELSVRTLVTTRLAECWIHTGDVATALGRTLPPTDRLQPIARLAWRTLPYAFSSAGKDLHGPVAFELRSPTGQRWDLVPDEDAVTVIRGDALDLCRVAARRVDPAATGLVGEGSDAVDVLDLVRTYA